MDSHCGGLLHVNDCMGNPAYSDSVWFLQGGIYVHSVQEFFKFIAAICIKWEEVFFFWNK